MPDAPRFSCAIRTGYSARFNSPAIDHRAPPSCGAFFCPMFIAVNHGRPASPVPLETYGPPPRCRLKRMARGPWPMVAGPWSGRRARCLRICSMSPDLLDRICSIGCARSAVLDRLCSIGCARQPARRSMSCFAHRVPCALHHGPRSGHHGARVPLLDSASEINDLGRAAHESGPRGGGATAPALFQINNPVKNDMG